jgi:phosphate transport system permease protein
LVEKISYFKQKGDPYILMTGLALVLALSMVFFVVAVILVKGLGFFWPKDIIEVRLKNNEVYLGELWDKETSQSISSNGDKITEEGIQIKMGNRDIYGRDFIWLKQKDVSESQYPKNATTFERFEYGNFYGFIKKLKFRDYEINESSEFISVKSKEAHDVALKNKVKIRKIEIEMNDLIAPLTNLQREILLLEISRGPNAEDNKTRIEKLRKQTQDLEQKITPEYLNLSKDLEKVHQENQQIYVLVETVDKKEISLTLDKVVRFYQPNQMNVIQKNLHYVSKLWEFLTSDPRESNTEGGIFPAIFGTVMMVLLMSIAVVPFGILAALYLNEYAHQGTVIRLIRLSVNNLAGVPSIVFGIFGLGFFIYMVGGTLDQLLFSDKLPEPTLGTGGILWASLTLALLTLPVVVVATEEGILTVPRANKEGALALGATRWQMIRKIVLPNAMPGILTGLILAISRGAGEVAPLMITGVVKLAPSLPIDGIFPFIHLDRKFMHLGFHIYDVAFQSPNVEAAKPMVYTTALLLILIVVVLNLLAIYMRNHLRKKYKTSVF